MKNNLSIFKNINICTTEIAFWIPISINEDQKFIEEKNYRIRVKFIKRSQ